MRFVKDRCSSLAAFSAASFTPESTRIDKGTFFIVFVGCSIKSAALYVRQCFQLASWKRVARRFLRRAPAVPCPFSKPASASATALNRT